MMWNEVHFLVVASLCLLGCATLRLARPGWRLPQRTLAWLALLCIAVGLGYAALRRGDWPLPSGAEATPVVAGAWMVMTGGAALVWLLLNDRGSRQALGRDRSWWFAYAVIVLLLLWGMMRWTDSSALSGTAVGSTTVGLVPRVLRLMASLMLVLAAGAWVHAGSLAVGELAAERMGKGRAAASDRESEEDAGYAVTGASAVALAAFPLLTASLLLSVTAGLYTQGIYWNWAAVDSWRLLAWLLAASLWSGWTLLGWRERRSQVLAVIGLALVLLMLAAIGG